VFHITASPAPNAPPEPDAPPEPNAVASTVVLIGDPKQSIYRFRGADIDSYLAARLATQGRHDTLTDNYRATPALVGAVNHVFSYAESQPQGAFGYQPPHDALTENPLPFIAVTAKGQARPLAVTAGDGAASAVPALTAWALPGADALSQGEFSAQMAEHTASAIALQLNLGQAGQCVFMDGAGNAEPIAPQDIAVLVSKGSQAALIQQALNQRGIKSVYLSDRQNVFASPEAQDVLRWLWAMAEPHRLSLVRAALGSGSLCQSVAQLDALRDDAALDEAVARFALYGRIWQTLGVLPAMYQLLHDYAVPAQLLAAPFAERSGERRLTNVLHLADWAQNAQAELAGRDALLQRLAQALTTAQDTEHELRLEQDAHLVRILTIHSAKGLQFPVVYLPFLPLVQIESTKNKPIATPWRSTNAPTVGEATDPAVSAVSDSVMSPAISPVMSLGDFPAALAAEKKERHAEGLRLIYVALTRAESACIMTLGPVKMGNVKTPNQAGTPLGYLLGLQEKEAFAPSFAAAQAALAACPFIQVVAPPPIDLTPYTALAPQALHAARSAHHRARVDWRMTSFSGLTAHLHRGQAPIAPPRPAPETAAQDRWPDARVEAALRQAHAQAAELIEGDFPENSLNTAGLTPALTATSLALALAQLPRGTEFGTQMHRLFELAGVAGFAPFAPHSACVALVRDTYRAAASPLTSEQEASLATLVQRVLCLPLWATDARAPITLVALQRYQIELEFWLPVPHMPIAALDALLCAHVLPQQARPALLPKTLVGQIKGFMDLVFEADGRFYVLDYKSNWLGDTFDAYAPDRLAQAVLTARYDLQMLLYLAALHRHLIDRLPDYDPALHLGGAFYLFVRGVDSPGAGVYFMRPDSDVMAALDALLEAMDTAQWAAAV
ncbi:MAG: PD-(D/E)XK nuclease family protein, partial [Halothiobacillaceae bacterium]|nr:PD-(D/E)XK nuclease family protein [Halothiobacillaceae bacterium]